MKPQATPVIVHSIRPSSRGLSVRKLPPPSLGAIREIADYYEKKAGGDYESLSTRYLYLMIQELRQILTALDGNASESEIDSLSKRLALDRMRSDGDDLSTIYTAISSCDDNGSFIPPTRYRQRKQVPWRERRRRYRDSVVIEELKEAVALLEEELDRAERYIASMEQVSRDKVKSKQLSHNKAIKEERAKFESLYENMVDKYTRELLKVKQETEIVRREAQSSLATVQRNAQEELSVLKKAWAEEKEVLLKKYSDEVTSLKDEQAAYKDKVAERMATARKEYNMKSAKDKDALLRKHESELLSIRREAAAMAARNSKHHEKETVLGPDGVELLAKIIQNKENARDVLVQSLLERETRRSKSAKKNRAKLYRG